MRILKKQSKQEESIFLLFFVLQLYTSPIVLIFSFDKIKNRLHMKQSNIKLTIIIILAILITTGTSYLIFKYQTGKQGFMQPLDSIDKKDNEAHEVSEEVIKSLIPNTPPPPPDPEVIKSLIPQE